LNKLGIRRIIINLIFLNRLDDGVKDILGSISIYKIKNCNGGMDMNNQSIGIGANMQKKIIVNLLYLGTLIIIFLGAFFGAYSVLFDIKIKVLNADVPGIVFGLLVAYLGLRYYLQVDKFKTEFYKNNSKFSWSNFKKSKKK